MLLTRDKVYGTTLYEVSVFLFCQKNILNILLKSRKFKKFKNI